VSNENQSAAKSNKKQGFFNGVSRRRIAASSSLLLLATTAQGTSAFVTDSMVRDTRIIGSRSIDLSSNFTPRSPTFCLPAASSTEVVGEELTSRFRFGMRASPKAMSHTSARSLTKGRSSECNPLSYRMGDEEDYGERIVAHNEAVGKSIVVRKQQLHQWNTLNQHSREDQPSHEQLQLDKYLESIDRRYHRLHDDEKVGSKNWTWNWLMQRQPSQQDKQSSCNQSDALCVLGLADLASDRLLKQHRLPLHQSAPILTDAASTDIKQQRFNPLMSTIRSVCRKQAKCVATIAIHTRKHRKRALRFVGRAITQAPTTISSSLISVAGSKRTVRTTVALLSFLVVLLKPICQAPLKA